MNKVKKSANPYSSDWDIKLRPLLEKYSGKKHPLNYGNIYQLVVMTILSAADTGQHVNKIAPALFAIYPDMKSLKKANLEELQTALKGVTGYRQKAESLIDLATIVKSDAGIPLTMEALSALPRIGRKTANVIQREAKVKAEGVIVDLHVLRVGPRLGIAKGIKADDIEKQLMQTVSQHNWGEVGMGLSFLGRETCRPKEPKCGECVVNKVCEYFASK